MFQHQIVRCDEIELPALSKKVLRIRSSYNRILTAFKNGIRILV